MVCLGILLIVKKLEKSQKHTTTQGLLFFNTLFYCNFELDNKTTKAVKVFYQTSIYKFNFVPINLHILRLFTLHFNLSDTICMAPTFLFSWDPFLVAFRVYTWNWKLAHLIPMFSLLLQLANGFCLCCWF